jgi:hypothetical protein
VYDLNSLDLGLELEHPRLTPAATDRTVPKLSDRLERNEGRPTCDDGRVPLRELRTRNEIGAEDVSVDNDRPARASRAHD